MSILEDFKPFFLKVLFNDGNFLRARKLLQLYGFVCMGFFLNLASPPPPLSLGEGGEGALFISRRLHQQTFTLFSQGIFVAILINYWTTTTRRDFTDRRLDEKREGRWSARKQFFFTSRQPVFPPRLPPADNLSSLIYTTHLRDKNSGEARRKREDASRMCDGGTLERIRRKKDRYYRLHYTFSSVQSQVAEIGFDTAFFLLALVYSIVVAVCCFSPLLQNSYRKFHFYANVVFK